MNEQTQLISSWPQVLSERRSLRRNHNEVVCLSMTISLPSVQAQVLALQSPTAENIPRRPPLHFDYWSVNNEECSRNTCHVDVAAARTTCLREAMGWGDCERLVGNQSSEANTQIGSSRICAKTIFGDRAVIGCSDNEAWTECLFHSALSSGNQLTNTWFHKHSWSIKQNCHKRPMLLWFYQMLLGTTLKLKRLIVFIKWWHQQYDRWSCQ